MSRYLTIFLSLQFEPAYESSLVQIILRKSNFTFYLTQLKTQLKSDKMSHSYDGLIGKLDYVYQGIFFWCILFRNQL